jgi:hypothetical protein
MNAERSNRAGDHGVTVAISIDTEEDDWGAYVPEGATSANIAHLRQLQALFDRHDARPTYLVNRAPLLEPEAVAVLGELAAHPHVEIGAHCHPWNTPPFPSSEGPVRTMMCAYTAAENAAKLAEVGRLLRGELGVEPRSFRAGRWGFGPTVARPLADLGYEVDCSVSPFIDWSSASGPDYSDAPHRPYRFDPVAPLTPRTDGRLLQLPTTVGFLWGEPRRRAALRRGLERSLLRRLKVVGILDRAGVLSKRWLSPEHATGEEMVRLADASVALGQSFLQLTFHSCTLLPGATPFVRDDRDRQAFLGAIDRFLRHCVERGFAFGTLSEAGALYPRDADPFGGGGAASGLS